MYISRFRKNLTVANKLSNTFRILGNKKYYLKVAVPRFRYSRSRVAGALSKASITSFRYFAKLRLYLLDFAQNQLNNQFQSFLQSSKRIRHQNLHHNTKGAAEVMLPTVPLLQACKSTCLMLQVREEWGHFTFFSSVTGVL